MFWDRVRQIKTFNDKEDNFGCHLTGPKIMAAGEMVYIRIQTFCKISDYSRKWCLSDHDPSRHMQNMEWYGDLRVKSRINSSSKQLVRMKNPFSILALETI